MIKLTAPVFGREEIDLVAQCLASGWVTQGPLTQQFEQRIGAIHGADHALATTSCTAALHLAVMALGLEPGDEVIVPAFTWVTSAYCAAYVGAKVVFADVDAETFNISPAALERAITPRTRAVVAVHLFGMAADMDAILSIARRHGLAVIEDAACAVGSTYHGYPVGALGDLGCLSFHPRKIITTGEGGMVLTNRTDLAARVAVLRNHGASPARASEQNKPWSMAEFHSVGFNLRLSDIQAAVGVAQCERLAGLIAERRTCADRYCALLADEPEVVLPQAPSDSPGHTYQSFVVRLSQGGRERRNVVTEALQAKGVPTRPGTHAVHRLHYFRETYGTRSEDFPIAALCEDTSITMPIFPGMTEADQVFVVDALSRALRSHPC